MDQIWYSLQAWKLQQRIWKAKFRKDPIVEAVFNQYIKDSVVSQTRFDNKITLINEELALILELVGKTNSNVQRISS